jgi:hypothetical protein
MFMSFRSTRKALFLSAIATIVLTCAVASAADDPETAMKTVGGELRVAGDVLSPNGQKLTLNKKTIPGTDGEVVALKQRFHVGDNDIILVMNGSVGACCTEFSSLYFLTVTPTGKAMASTGNDSIDIDADGLGSADVKVDGNQLLITTVTVDGRRKKTHRYIFANGKVAASK